MVSSNGYYNDDYIKIIGSLNVFIKFGKVAYCLMIIDDHGR